MNDVGLWRQEGPKAFLAFLASATGEDHDAAVYDTKLEFDPSSEAAVRYVASVAMTKACQGSEVFYEPMPEDGSVVPYNEMPEDPWTNAFYQERLAKENSVDFYIPNSTAYSDSAIRAITYRRILADDMTEGMTLRFSSGEEKFFDYVLTETDKTALQEVARCAVLKRKLNDLYTDNE